MKINKMFFFSILTALFIASYAYAQPATLSQLNTYVTHLRGNFTSTVLSGAAPLCNSSTIEKHIVNTAGNYVEGIIRYSGCKGQPGRPVVNSIVASLNSAAQSVNANAYVKLSTPGPDTVVILYKVFTPKGVSAGSAAASVKQEADNQVNVLQKAKAETPTK